MATVESVQALADEQHALADEQHALAARIAEMHGAYSLPLQRYCYRILHCDCEAEDAVQVTFIHAFQALRRGCDPQRERPWLYRIARNVCLNRQRALACRPVAAAEYADGAYANDVDQTDPYEQLLTWSDLRGAIGELPHNQRTAIVMREVQGATYREISSAIGTSQSSVESLLWRARRQVAAALADARPRLLAAAPLTAARAA